MRDGEHLLPIFNYKGAALDAVSWLLRMPSAG
jgi:hypothetical protein